MNDICSVDILENRKNFLIHYSQRQTLRPAQRKRFESVVENPSPEVD